MNSHWIVINTLVDCLENGIDKEKVKSAILQLDIEIDKCLINNMPTDEIKSIKSVLEHINYEIYTNNE